MIRTSRILPKDYLFTLVERDDIAKVELKNTENHSLTNPNVCRAQIYYRWPIEQLNSMAGQCKTVCDNDELMGSDKEFVASFYQVKKTGFINAKHIIRLHRVEQRTGVSLGIPHKLIKLAEKLENIKNTNNNK